jgi:hypothetical protein
VSRERLIWTAIAVLALGLEVWLLAGRRSGEPAYDPPAATVGPSIEIAGREVLTQTFVPGVDGLESVRFVPRLTGGPLRAPVELTLEADGSDVPMAQRRLAPGELADGVPFLWEVPRVERAAARRFTFTIAVPDAAPGQGLRVAIGPPGYRWGELRVADRRQWGDLVFATRATQVHVLGSLRRLRRELPWPFGTEAALIAGILALNAAAAVVIRYLAGADLAVQPACDAADAQQAHARRGCRGRS